MRDHRRAIAITVAVAGILGLDALSTAQLSGRQRVAFEVASVRVNDALISPRQVVNDTRVDLIRVSLGRLLLMAYKIDGSRLAGPEWMRQRVDIHATIPAGRTRKDVPEMLRTLLTERFGLEAHFEPRPTDVCELTVSADGLKLREVQAKDDRQTPYPVASGNPAYDSMNGPPNDRRIIQTPDRGTRIITAQTNYERRSTERGTTVYDATRVSMVELIDMLSASVGKPVIDKTGLKGLYQFRLELPSPVVPDLLTPVGITTTRNGPEPSSSSAYKAVAALGLKLDDRRLPVDVLIIDSLMQAPTPN